MFQFSYRINAKIVIELIYNFLFLQMIQIYIYYFHMIEYFFYFSKRFAQFFCPRYKIHLMYRRDLSQQ